MEERPPILSEQMSQEDWEGMPASGKQLVEELRQRVMQLEAEMGQLRSENQLLREQINRTSTNSSQPPSQDPPRGFKTSPKRQSGKKRGGQPGHEGHERPLYPIEQCDSVTDYYPQNCGHCGTPLTGEDSSPYRHQVVDIPPIELQIEEHRFHQLSCESCGAMTRASYAEVIADGGYGERVAAHVGLLSSVYRQSQRMVQRALSDLFGVEMYDGSVNRLRQEISAAVAAPVEQAQQYVQQQPVVGVDETSFGQGNTDGKNPQHTLLLVVGGSDTPSDVFSSRAESLPSSSPGCIGTMLQRDRYQ